MTPIEKNLGLLTKEERKQSVDDIIGYFYTERKEEIGVIAAEDILDFFLQNIGKFVYNTALGDARKELEKGTEEIDFKMSELKR